MTAEQPQPWYERLIPASLRGIFARSNESVTLTGEQLEAEEFDDGDLGPYDSDDQWYTVFQPPLRYSEERGQWVARFRNLEYPSRTFKEPHTDWTYTELLADERGLSC